MKAVIHVNQHIIKANAKKEREPCRVCNGSGELTAVINPDWPNGTEPYQENTGDPCGRCNGSGLEPLDAPLTVKTYKANIKAHEVEINGPSKVIYSPDKPLDCGARVWIETDSKYVNVVEAIDDIKPPCYGSHVPDHHGKCIDCGEAVE